MHIMGVLVISLPTIQQHWRSVFSL